MVRFIENIVITIDVFLLLGSEIYLFWLIDWLIASEAAAALSCTYQSVAAVVQAEAAVLRYLR